MNIKQTESPTSISTSAPTSLLSAYLEDETMALCGREQSTMTQGRPSMKYQETSIQCPATVEDVRMPPPSTIFKKPTARWQLSYYKNLEAPLASASYRTMMKEYDTETKHMYERILSRRHGAEGKLFPTVRESNDDIAIHGRKGQWLNDDEEGEAAADYLESDCLFDLDL